MTIMTASAPHHGADARNAGAEPLRRVVCHGTFLPAALLAILVMIVLVITCIIPGMVRNAFAAPSTSSSTSTSADATTTTVCVIARVTAVYDADASLASVANGTLTLDEDASKEAADNVCALCRAVIGDENLALSLAISPALVEHWATSAIPTADAGTPTMTDPATEGTATGSTDGVIPLLVSAQATGRLELLSTGYGDPSFSLLSSIGRVDDIAMQYATTAGTTPLSFSSGTAPADLALPDGTARALAGAGITWAAVDSSKLDASGSSSVGVFTSAEDGDLSILGVDQSANLIDFDDADTAYSHMEEAMGGTVDETAGTAADVAAGASADGTASPSDIYATVVEIGDTDQAGQTLVDLLQALVSDHGCTLLSAGAAVADASATSPTSASYRDDGSDAGGHADDTLSRARQDVTALGDILYSGSTDYETALHLSLLSEFAGWDDATDISTACARKASDLIDGLFDGIHLDVEDMVLASDDGAITIDINNDTASVYEVTLDYDCTDGMTIGGQDAKGTTVLVYSGLNTIQIDVAMTVPKGILTVSASSDGRTYVSDSSMITTSHIDDITLVVCSVITIAIVVGTILHRRRRSRAA